MPERLQDDDEDVSSGPKGRVKRVRQRQQEPTPFREQETPSGALANVQLRRVEELEEQMRYVPHLGYLVLVPKHDYLCMHKHISLLQLCKCAAYTYSICRRESEDDDFMKRLEVIKLEGREKARVRALSTSSCNHK